MNGNGKVQVLLVSPQAFFRKGVELALSNAPDIAIISSSAGVDDQILAALDSLLPEVALVDIDAPADSGLNSAYRIKQRAPSVAVVMLTSSPSDTQLFQALKGQAAAYLSKEVTDEQLLDTIHRVARGEHPINESLVTRPKVAEQVLQQFQELTWQNAESLVSPLTPRETEILNYIGQGFLNKQIAAKLGISEQTIKNHVTSILRKLNANARTEAVVVAIRQGLISIG
ncbi:MAG: response regulator transcription factor [Chloroflexi bacterium]|nr:response regulator transcription factor [Chloroflexota bacterium]